MSNLFLCVLSQVCACVSGFKATGWRGRAGREHTGHACCLPSEIPLSGDKAFCILGAGLAAEPSLLCQGYRLTGTGGSADCV